MTITTCLIAEGPLCDPLGVGVGVGVWTGGDELELPPPPHPANATRTPAAPRARRADSNAPYAGLEGSPGIRLLTKRQPDCAARVSPRRLAFGPRLRLL